MRIALATTDDPVAAVRTSVGESLVLVFEPGRDPLAMAQALAAIGPLAIEVAPARRVNAVVVTHGAMPEDIDAAVAFLDQALSTTGQIITVA